MRFSVAGNLLGSLLIFIGLAQVFPLIWSIFYEKSDLYAFVISIITTLVVGLVLRKITNFKDDISLKESFAFVSLSWIFAAGFGALPFYLSGALPSYVDAYFEAMSGFTTTGATVIENIEVLPHGILFWRSLTHWLGGMGIIALFVAVMPKLGARGMNLLKAEVPGPISDKVVPRVAETAKILWIIYILISALETILLMLSGFSLFDALTHTFATMATGGFSTKNLSVGAFNNPLAEIIIILFMFIAGGNFSLYYSLAKRKYKELLYDNEFRFYTFLVVFCIIIVTASLRIFHYNDLFLALRKAAFQVISIITTTGFTTDNFDAWSPLAKGILFSLMFIGGCGGSTAGAIKQIRILILIKHSFREIYKMIHPKAVIPLRVGNKVVTEEIVTNILGFMFLYLTIFVIASLTLASMGIDLISSLTAVAATLGNVGPGLGMVGPLNTYSPIPDLGKILLTLMMLIGRLEIYTVLVLLLPDYRRYRYRKGFKLF